MCPYQPRQYPDTLYPQLKQEPRARSSSCVSSNLGRIQEPGALRVFFVAKAGSRRSQELLIYPQYPRQDQGARSSTCVPFSQAGSRSQELLMCPQQSGRNQEPGAPQMSSQYPGRIKEPLVRSSSYVLTVAQAGSPLGKLMSHPLFSDLQTHLSCVRKNVTCRSLKTKLILYVLRIQAKNNLILPGVLSLSPWILHVAVHLQLGIKNIRTILSIK